MGSSAEGAFRLRRITNQVTRAATIPRAARPPTTPPAMAPALELDLELCGVEPVPDGSEVDTAPFALPVALPDGTVAVGIGVAVDSGLSPAACESVALQVPPTVTFKYAQWGTAVFPGMTSGYCVTKTAGQLASQKFHASMETPWQAVQAMNREYMTVLHSQSSAEPFGGGT